MSPSVPIPSVSFHAHNDVFALPLVKKFQIFSPRAPLIQAIINEQHANDTVTAIQKEEEKYRNELLKKVNNSTTDNNNSSITNANANAGNNNNNNVNQGKNQNSKRSNAKKSSAEKIANKKATEELESKINILVHSLNHARQTLHHHLLITQAAIQGHYTKEATKLNPTFDGDSDQENDELSSLRQLMESYEYLSDADKRLIYARELIPVMKKIGLPDLATSIMDLPYIQLFHIQSTTSPLVTSFIEEMHQLSITEELRRHIPTEQQNNDAEKRRLIKDAQESLLRKTLAASELVRKHYRKQSVKLHPDRVGEEFRHTFEQFTDARDVLSNDTLRQRYLKEMISVYKTFGVPAMASSHRAWNDRHRPDKAEERKRHMNEKKKKEEGKPLRLEGGLHHQTPKGVMLQHVKEKNSHKVIVSVHALQPLHEFYARVRSVTVDLTSAEGGSHTLTLNRGDVVGCGNGIKFDNHTKQMTLSNYIACGELSLEPGHWECYWFATLDMVGNPDITSFENVSDDIFTSRTSATATFRVVDQAYTESLENFAKLEEACKIVKAELQSTVNKLKRDDESISRYGYHHEILVRANKKARNLKGAMAKTGHSSDVYDALCKTVEASRHVFEHLEEEVERSKKNREKKDTAKGFKAFLARVLESEDPVSWMREVTQEALEMQGGDANRLYQLFIEGKGKCVLMVDFEMLSAASARNDLFSCKQCSDLAAKADSASIQETKEEADAIAAEAQRKKEEEERAKLLKEAELRRKWSICGNDVMIHGLTSKKGQVLNSTAGRVTYYNVDNDRFEVLCNVTGEKAYLKEASFSIQHAFRRHGDMQHPQSSNAKKKAFPSSSKSEAVSPALPGGWDWGCSRCTFKNKADHTECIMCSNPRKFERSVDDDEDEKKEDGTGSIAKPIAEQFSVNEKAGGDASIRPDSSHKKIEKTVYVIASHSKRLTGNKGRKKKDLMAKSGANIQIDTQTVSNHVPVHLSGTKQSIQNAILFIQEAIGLENVCNEMVKPIPTLMTKCPPADKIESSPAVAALPEMKEAVAALSSQVQDATISELDTKTVSTQHSFGDALLPQGLMEMSIDTPSEMTSDLPSEIGITITNASVSSLIGSQASRLYSRQYSKSTNRSVPENDPLVSFLRSQHQCIKGSVEEFYTWLVESEDIDSMDALKEAVSDEEYLNECMKFGNGSIGLKGFKRKAFQRAVFEYANNDPMSHCSGILSSDTTGLHSNRNGPNCGHAMTGHNHAQSHDQVPSELFCPIDLVLMTEDPVLAEDGVTYERAAIEKWFQTQILKIEQSQNNLLSNPSSQRDIGVVRNGVRSPVRDLQIKNLGLTPNTSIKNMARDYKLRMDEKKKNVTQTMNQIIF